jgi:hypothetical protein
MNENLWELLFKFFGQVFDEEAGDILEYDYEGLDNYKCVITAYKEGDVITVNLIDIDDWEMILDISEVTETELSDVVKGLTDKEVYQIRLKASEFGL